MGIRTRRKNKQEAETSSRRTQVTAQDLMDAAVRLLGTHRSVSTLSLREIAREAGIAPNSFYRHFRDVDELTVALIDQAGRALRGIIREARQRLSMERSAIRTSVEAFMDQLDADEKYLQVLLREMSTGSDAFRQAVERELTYFEDELRDELERMEKLTGHATFEPALTAKAITRLVVAMGASAASQSLDQRAELIDQTVIMIRMIMVGSQAMAKKA
ncbi:MULTISPECIES: HTH-type transcriptional repressor FabR [Spongiibacter]|jgi:AcrR family transcriptional regulator|uniref:HTH-type transcriptional repressor FabR n=1 Tax=Spongiibacter TaxID=630749 RepID=UPI000C0AE32E|nr:MULTISPECIES: HTH-type transcriptional repressor FabR [Spongiibacter]MAK44487.1 HTH-type transcriptional repressor FabR [Spongiibacter sp.]MBM7421802.1 AcrR family transcriptional regulator [Spongiibacter marinus]MEE2651783.1 HTH-type transcriptional repressor FabR [Pseudomonadota bacterium]|tara:strand:+ start:6560 stop:7210 length:651 start_codon:yes stop_codon:yes gene_type:complete